MGQSILWLVECKAWQTRIPKEKVLAHRQIVDDLGADRGFVMNEKGFQKGALEAALNANVQLTSLAELRETCGHDLGLERLRRIYERIFSCRERYWDIPKSVRIDYGLRGEFDPSAYSGDRVINTVESCAIRAILSGFPVVYDEVLVPMSRLSGGTIDPGSVSLVFDEPHELVTHLSEKIIELEMLLTRAERHTF
jgi:hypothetical protein